MDFDCHKEKCEHCKLLAGRVNSGQEKGFSKLKLIKKILNCSFLYGTPKHFKDGMG